MVRVVWCYVAFLENVVGMQGKLTPHGMEGDVACMLEVLSVLLGFWACNWGFPSVGGLRLLCCLGLSLGE